MRKVRPGHRRCRRAGARTPLVGAAKQVPVVLGFLAGENRGGMASAICERRLVHISAAPAVNGV